MRGAILSDLLLVFVTVLWGSAFVAQQLGMNFLGAFGFNACRFLLGALLVWSFSRLISTSFRRSFEHENAVRNSWRAGASVGLLLFLGATFQQTGLAGTTAGKAGFLTVLYAVLVPFISHFSGVPVKRTEIFGSLIAFVGSYYLSTTHGPFSFGTGDMLVIAGSVCWAFHALAISKAVQHHNALDIAWQQFLFCGVLSLLAAAILEPLTVEQVFQARFAILFAGGASIALGYTLQVVVQRHVSPAHAVIIFSLEGVFAAIAGWYFLNEHMSTRAIAGAVIMLAGVLIAQLGYRNVPRTPLLIPNRSPDPGHGN